MQRLGVLIVLTIALVFVVLVMLFIGSLGQLFPGSPVVALLMGGVFLTIGILALRAVFSGRGAEPSTPAEPEDVTDLDVFFVCGLCGTEFRVEKVGELQVPRHCGERMLVERRPRALG
jgi:DNA-directed RNA polymerase subunit RPC12/RpoP